MTEESVPLLQEEMDVPQAPFTFARRDDRGRKLPQAVAHRGYKAAFPENTMGAFKGAVEAGAHAIETDIHISKDGVVVLSHDPDLKRCFGKEEKIIDCDWSYLKTLQTLREPRQPMPRLKDLLEYLTTPGLEDVWLLLDIKIPWPIWSEVARAKGRKEWAKTDNEVDDVMRLIAVDLAGIKPTKPWDQRVVLGCWAAKYLPLYSKYLPNYPIVHIGFNTTYARQFLAVPNVGFNMLFNNMVGPFSNAFLRRLKEAKRSIYLWTVNEEMWMEWSIEKEVDVVITDDPKKFLKVCDDYDGAESHSLDLPLRSWKFLIWLNIKCMGYGILYMYRYGFTVDYAKVKQVLESSKAKSLE